MNDSFIKEMFIGTREAGPDTAETKKGCGFK
jgi:hypothetical protein